uniref:Reverse transcriptase zinc-binding domain-containing protein n=1 Tax=Davidia involucrata TaxID=16924 RepID=A0A5B7CCF1_DAVIN
MIKPWTREPNSSHFSPVIMLYFLEAHVCDCGYWEGGSMIWVPHFRHNLHDWELDEALSLLGLLNHFKISVGRDDSLIWTLGGSWKFTVRLFYQELAKKGDLGFSLKSIWEARVPLNVAFFAWVVDWNTVQTLDNLQRRVLFYFFNGK